MTDEPDSTPDKPRRNGAFLGSIIGVLMWFNQPAGLLNVSGITEWVAMAAFVGVCMVVGVLIERLIV